MATRKPVDAQRPKVILPDLPRPLFPEMEPRTAEHHRPAPRPVQRPPRARVEPAVTRRPPGTSRQHGRAPAQPQRETIVLPTPRQIAGQTVPSLVAAVSLWLCAHSADLLSPRGMPLWIVLLLGPGVGLFLVSDRQTHPYWRHGAIANVAIICVVLPMLALRRYTIAVPSFALGHGVMLAPAIATVAVIVVLIALGVGIAGATREDPEYAGLLLLPAAMLVPICVGMSMDGSLVAWLSAAAGVFVAVGVATVIASLLPGTLAALVAPGALALEFLFLTLVERTPVFPHASGFVAVLLFWGVLVVVVALSVLLPLLSQWFGRIDRLARTLEYAAA